MISGWILIVSIYSTAGNVQFAPEIYPNATMCLLEASRRAEQYANTTKDKFSCKYVKDITIFGAK
jgi:hypothetical protein